MAKEIKSLTVIIEDVEIKGVPDNIRYSCLIVDKSDNLLSKRISGKLEISPDDKKTWKEIYNDILKDIKTNEKIN